MSRSTSPFHFRRSVHVLYTCKQCKKAGATVVERVSYRLVGAGEEIWYLGRMRRSGTKTWYLEDREVLRDSIRGEDLPQRSCPPCAAPLSADRVCGRTNDSIACGPRCRNATGPDCECSCGGANHGAAYG